VYIYIYIYTYIQIYGCLWIDRDGETERARDMCIYTYTYVPIYTETGSGNFVAMSLGVLASVGAYGAFREREKIRVIHIDLYICIYMYK